MKNSIIKQPMLPRVKIPKAKLPTVKTPKIGFGSKKSKFGGGNNYYNKIFK